eukprot:scaffold21040_cov41-Cyclotella_meneghiniana.AAC.2
MAMIMRWSKQHIRNHCQTLSDKAGQGNIVMKNLAAVKTFRAFVELAVEATQISLRAAQVEVRTVEPYGVCHLQKLHRVMIHKRDGLRHEYKVIKSENKKAIAHFKNLT